MTNRLKIKPCLCGKMPKLERSDLSGGGLDSPLIRLFCDHTTKWYYEEEYRSDIGGYKDTRDEAMKKAIDEWNTRTSSSEDVVEKAKQDWIPMRGYTIDAAHELADVQYELSDWAVTHADKLFSHIAALESDNKRLREALFNIVNVIKAGGAISSSKDKIGFPFKLHEAINAAEADLEHTKR